MHSAITGDSPANTRSRLRTTRDLLCITQIRHAASRSGFVHHDSHSRITRSFLCITPILLRITQSWFYITQTEHGGSESWLAVMQNQIGVM